MSEVTNDLNKNSGLLGIAGFSDNRDVEKLYLEGDERASLAFEMYCDRISKYIAEYYLELEGKVDAIIFTAGVGENGAIVRELVTDKLAPLGISLDKEFNSKVAGFKEIKSGKISNSKSKIAVYVEPTDEEVMIIRDTYSFVK